MATPSAASLNAQFKSRTIALELIDEPACPERKTMEEIELAELAMNISQMGLIKPLIVKPVGARFETVAGHRRLLACRIAEYSPVPCRVWMGGNLNPLAILVAENAHVEAVNPVEEAEFYARVLDEFCSNDVDLLCIAVGRRREYVEDRLLILRGHPKTVEALRHKQISLAVARELNKVADPNRLLILLDVSVQQGSSARQVSQWRRDAELQGPVFSTEAAAAVPVGDGVPIVQPHRMECLFCESDEDPHMMELVYLHKPCKKLVLNVLNRTPQQQPI